MVSISFLAYSESFLRRLSLRCYNGCWVYLRQVSRGFATESMKIHHHHWRRISLNVNLSSRFQYLLEVGKVNLLTSF
ncbi:hypothetical protein [Rubritalea tangerina]|uniref:hypothetical protein n=1 Tax=Rubritalea tangerina TaxID=430798 RepID=UPI00360E8011